MNISKNDTKETRQKPAAMRLAITTPLACSPEAAWREIKKPSLLAHVARPIVTFKAVDPSSLPQEWVSGEAVRLRFFVFGFIPFGGVRTLRLFLDDEAMQLQSYEHDSLIRRWDHLIKVNKGADGVTHYTDSLELDAGWLTLPVWFFAQLFYRHRQRRWRKLARRLTAVEDV